MPNILFLLIKFEGLVLVLVEYFTHVLCLFKVFWGLFVLQADPGVSVGWIQTWASAKALQHVGHLLNPMN